MFASYSGTCFKLQLGDQSKFLQKIYNQSQQLMPVLVDTQWQTDIRNFKCVLNSQTSIHFSSMLSSKWIWFQMP